MVVVAMKATAIVAVVVVVCSVLVRKLQRTSRVQTAVEVSSALVKYRPPDVYSKVPGFLLCSAV